MDARRAVRFAEGELREDDLDRGELAMAELVHKSVVAPARLEPKHLDRLAAAYGVRGAVELTAVLSSFHFINRIADLVGIQSDLPMVQPRFDRVRRVAVRFQGWVMGRMIDMRNQRIELDAGAALAEAEAVLGPFPSGFQVIRSVPNVAGFLTTVSRVVQHFEPEMLEHVTRAVAEALPTCEEEATGFHERPPDPLDALAFVGTRYAVRTTDRMVDDVREKYGYDDARLTDLFYAISMRNALERMNRLLARPRLEGR